MLLIIKEKKGNETNMYGEEAFKGPAGFKPFGAPEEKGIKPSPLAGITKLFNWKIILVIVIIAIIAYWFFFINKPIRTITFNAIDFEGKPVVGAIITVLNEQGQTIKADVLPGTPIQLAEGNYRLTVDLPEGSKLSAESQKTASGLTVSQDTTLTLKLVPDIKLSLTVDSFPDQMYAGQILGSEANINLIIENKSDFDAKNLELEIVFAGKDKPINITPGITKFDLKANESVQVNLSIEVPPGFKATSAGTPLTIDFKVKGFADKASVETTILPKVDIQIKDPFNKKIEANVEAGSLQQVKTIKVRNNGAIAVEPLAFTVELDEAVKEIASDWFSFSFSSVPAAGLLQPATDYTTTFLAEIPGDANLQTINGFINIGNDLWSDKIQLFLTVEKPITKLELRIPTKTFELFRAVENSIEMDWYEKESVDVTISNKGETKLLDLLLSLTPDAITAGCGDYITILKTQLNDLAKLENDTSKIEVSAPTVNACPAAYPCTTVCDIQLNYKNEFNQSDSKKETLYITVMED